MSSASPELKPGAGLPTTVADAQVAAVTNVSLDPLGILGPTLADIAAEKAGIVKPGSVLVLGEVATRTAPQQRAEHNQRRRHEVRHLADERARGTAEEPAERPGEIRVQAQAHHDADEQ